jgi:hypothetical protein
MGREKRCVPRSSASLLRRVSGVACEFVIGAGPADEEQAHHADSCRPFSMSSGILSTVFDELLAEGGLPEGADEAGQDVVVDKWFGIVKLNDGGALRPAWRVIHSADGCSEPCVNLRSHKGEWCRQAHRSISCPRCALDGEHLATAFLFRAQVLTLRIARRLRRAPGRVPPPFARAAFWGARVFSVKLGGVWGRACFRGNFAKGRAKFRKELLNVFPLQAGGGANDNEQKAASGRTTTPRRRRSPQVAAGGRRHMQLLLMRKHRGRLQQ